MLSMFDDIIEINNDRSAVSVVHKGAHAGLIIETMHPDSGEREVLFAHFLPKSRGVAFLAPPAEGMVSYRLLHGIQSLDELMDRLALDHQASRSYTIKKDLVDAMVATIKEQASGVAPVPQFHIRGLAYSQETFNSCSWVQSKLMLVGVILPVSWYDGALLDTVNLQSSSCLIS